jgi:uncharacterized protein YbjT (DUF2867 family)
MASYMLEQAFSDLEIEQIFVRPAYYFSNWLGYLELVKENGILPTFFPPEMELPMVAPPDVAKFLAEVMTCKNPQERIYEIMGPLDYSSLDMAKIFRDVLNRNVTLQQIFLSLTVQTKFSERLQFFVKNQLTVFINFVKLPLIFQLHNHYTAN